MGQNIFSNLSTKSLDFLIMFACLGTLLKYHKLKVKHCILTLSNFDNGCGVTACFTIGRTEACGFVSSQQNMHVTEKMHICNASVTSYLFWKWDQV